MASIEEDEDLIALRSAVLASMKVKPKEKEPLEEDAELLALRQAALQSKRQKHSTVPDGSNHAEHLAIAKVQRIALPFSPASPKQFQSASQGWNNLIVIPLQEEQAPSRQPLPSKASSHKPTLLLPQDKWARGSTSGATGSANAAAATKEKKASSKFSRFESHDSDSEEEDEEDEDEDKSEEVDLLEKQIEQFLQGSSDQEDSGNENDRSPAGGTDSNYSGGESPAVKSENDHTVGDSPRAGSDGDSQCSGSEPDAEQSEHNLNSVKCCDKNSVDDLAIESTDKAVHSRSPSRARSSSSSSSGSSSSSHSSGSSSSWSSSWSSGSRSQSVSPDRHKSAISAGKQTESCDAKTVVKSTARGPPRPSGERRTHKSNWEHAADSRSVSLKVNSDRRSPYSDERQWGRRDMKQSTRTEPQGEMPSRKHPRDRLGHRAAPNLDAVKDAREKLEDRKRKFASSKTIQPDKRGTTIVLKSAMPSGKVATDKENRQSNVKLRLGAKKYGSHSGKDDRTQTGGTNPGNTKPEPLAKVKERLESFKSDDLSDSSDLFSFSDSDSDDPSSAPWRQKNTIERDETRINQERCIRRRNDRCIDGVVVAPRGGARVQDLHHTGRRQTPPRARHLKPRADPGWTAHHKDSGNEGEMREKDRRSLRSVMSVVKKNTDSADSNRSRSSSGNRDQKWRKWKGDLVVVDVHLDEPSKSVVVREESSLRSKGKASREEDARSIIQRLKRKGGPVEVDVELAVKEVKKARKSPPVVARVSPTINITFNKDAELPKSDARMSVHERLGVPRKSRHSKATPPPLAAPPKPISRQLESRVDVARKVVRYDDHSDDDDNSHRGTNGSRLMEGKVSVTRKHQVAAPVEKEMYSKKKTLLVLKTAGRRDCHEPETRQRIKPDHDDPEKIVDKKPTGHHYESELDARIQKIKEKNDQIMRRKQQIEDDKKKYG